MYEHYTTPVTEQFGDGGPLRAACGRYIIPAPLSAPIGRPCPACISQLTGCWPEHLERTAESRDCPLLRRLLGW